jgi:hypothetical protein
MTDTPDGPASTDTPPPPHRRRPRTRHQANPQQELRVRGDISSGGTVFTL